jgi:heptosyltransferase II
MIGDVLTTSILFDALRKKYPSATLDFLINQNTSAVVENHPAIDNLILLNSEEQKSLNSYRKVLTKIKENKYDAVVDVQGNLKSMFTSWSSNATYRIGYKKKLSDLFYTHSFRRLIKPQRQASLAIENRMQLIAFLDVPFQSISPKIYLKKQEIEKASNYLVSQNIDLKRPLYMISVLGSSPRKTYPASYMAQLLDTIIDTQTNAQLLFNYIPPQRAEALEIFDACKPSTQKAIAFDTYGKSLREFIAITHHCDALIGNEGGAIHMAKALDKPTFIIFSPHLNKANWFGDTETNKHQAVHLSDMIAHTSEDIERAKKDPRSYYLKFKPTFIQPKLIAFIRSL